MSNVIMGVRFDCCCEAVFEEMITRMIENGFSFNLDSCCWIFEENNSVKMVLALRDAFKPFGKDNITDIEYVEFVETSHKENWSSIMSVY